MRRRLIFAAFAYADNDKNDYCNSVGQKLKELFTGKGDSGNIAGGDIESSEDKRAEDRKVGLPDGEDNEGDSKPADIVDYIFPVAVKVVHNEGKSAETCYSATDTGGEVAITGNVDTCGIGGSGVFTYGTKVKSYAGTVEDKAG